jgi:hypothetical protein
MQISGPSSPSPIQLRLPAQTLQGVMLQQGATVQATVRQSDPSGQLTLEISGKLLQAISTLRLAAGITLQLRVEKGKDGIILHLDEPERQRLMYQQALRQNLPRQESLRPLLQQLAQSQSGTKNAAPTGPSSNTTAHDASKQTTASTAPLPKSVSQAITRLMSVLPTLEKVLQPAGLQQAIARSGLFLETHLLQGVRPAELESDVKTVLLRLAQTLRQQMGESHVKSGEQRNEQTQERLQGLLRQIDAGVARIQLNQLNSLSGRGEGEERLNITLELPLYNAQNGTVELLQLRIRRHDGKHRSKTGNSWSVTLHLSPEGYGNIRAVVTLSGGKISTTFWCEEETTAQLFREQLHQLQERFEQQGLETAQCSSRCGKPPEEMTEASTPTNGLIDTRV